MVGSSEDKPQGRDHGVAAIGDPAWMDHVLKVGLDDQPIRHPSRVVQLDGSFRLVSAWFEPKRRFAKAGMRNG